VKRYVYSVYSKVQVSHSLPRKWTYMWVKLGEKEGGWLALEEEQKTQPLLTGYREAI
jgi:hypothetical protein